MTNDDEHVPAPADHAPRKHAEYRDGWFVVVEDANSRAWVGCKSTREVNQ